MVIQEMTEQECRAMLAETNVARLACARNNQPYVVPIRVDLHGEFLYGYATLGLKIEWMRQNPLVCLEIDEISSPWQWRSIVVFGHYEELPHSPEYDGSRAIAESLFQRHPMWWEPSSVSLSGHEQRASVVFRIRIERMTGRRTPPAALSTPSLRGSASTGRRRRWLAHVLDRLAGRP